MRKDTAIFSDNKLIMASKNSNLFWKNRSHIIKRLSILFPHQPNLIYDIFLGYQSKGVDFISGSILSKYEDIRHFTYER